MAAAGPNRRSARRARSAPAAAVSRNNSARSHRSSVASAISVRRVNGSNSREQQVDPSCSRRPEARAGGAAVAAEIAAGNLDRRISSNSRSSRDPVRRNSSGPRNNGHHSSARRNRANNRSRPEAHRRRAASAPNGGAGSVAAGRAAGAGRVAGAGERRRSPRREPLTVNRGSNASPFPVERRRLGGAMRSAEC